MSSRELRFWPFLFGIYAIVWGLQALMSAFRGVPLVMTFDINTTDLAIFGIVVGVWLLALALRTEGTRKTPAVAV